MAKAQPVYLDNAATTPLDEEVFAAMQDYFLKHFGNAASKYYAEGRKALEAVETARQQVAQLIGAADASEVVFTSGASESNNWVIDGLLREGEKKHVVTSPIEHHAVLEPIEHLVKKGGVESTIVPVDEYGRVSPESVRDAIREDTGLISIMHANNEIGTLEPIKEIAAIARQAGVPFHTDACQTVGKIPVDVQEVGADLLSLSAHKFRGPKGIGALYIRKGLRLPTMIHGGGQENGRRAGTSNVPNIVGMGKAAELAGSRLGKVGPRERELVENLWSRLSESIPKVRRNGHPDQRIPNILNICVEGIEGEAILLRLDMAGIMVSSGSACTSGSLDPSHVLLAIGLPAEIAHGSVRFSLGADSTRADMDRVCEVLPGVVSMLRDMSPTWQG